MTDKHFRLSYLHAINTLKLLLEKKMQTSEKKDNENFIFAFYYSTGRQRTY